MLKGRKILIPVLALLPILGAGAWFLGPQLPIGGEKAEGHQAEESASKVHSPGPVCDVGERIVNLADPGGRRYLKVAVAFEFEEPETYSEASGGHGGTDKDKQFKSEMSPYVPLMQDTIISILTTKTTGQLASAEGKEQLKAEIKEQLNVLLVKHKVVNVFFTNFVMQ
ncbi:MAG: flagellar basal body-associated protein FliL [Chloroflexota bacterium]